MADKRDYDISYADMEAMPPGPEKAIQYAVSGLLVDGAHHKQWCLERVLEALGVDLAELRDTLEGMGYGWSEEGIAP